MSKQPPAFSHRLRTNCLKTNDGFRIDFLFLNKHILDWHPGSLITDWPTGAGQFVYLCKYALSCKVHVFRQRMYFHKPIVWYKGILKIFCREIVVWRGFLTLQMSEIHCKKGSIFAVPKTPHFTLYGWNDYITRTWIQNQAIDLTKPGS